MKQQCDRCKKETFDPNILGWNIYCNNCYCRLKKIIEIFDTEVSDNRELMVQSNNLVESVVTKI